jgi:pimeloyl-ACP methyl ester carboxylesterase
MRTVDPQTLYLDVGGAKTQILKGGQGPPVVFLHGFPTSAHVWRDLVPILAPRSRAIAPDLLERWQGGLLLLGYGLVAAFVFAGIGGLIVGNAAGSGSDKAAV